METTLTQVSVCHHTWRSDVSRRLSLHADLSRCLRSKQSRMTPDMDRDTPSWTQVIDRTTDEHFAVTSPVLRDSTCIPPSRMERGGWLGSREIVTMLRECSTLLANLGCCSSQCCRCHFGVDWMPGWARRQWKAVRHKTTDKINQARAWKVNQAKAWKVKPSNSLEDKPSKSLEWKKIKGFAPAYLPRRQHCWSSSVSAQRAALLRSCDVSATGGSIGARFQRVCPGGSIAEELMQCLPQEAALARDSSVSAQEAAVLSSASVALGLVW
jgi:hypothetical protein